MSAIVQGAADRPAMPRHAPAPMLGLVAAALLAAMLAGLSMGSSPMPLERLLPALIGQGSATDMLILWTLRAPRVLLAGVAGASLGLAGLVLQRATRNALAAPSVLGVTDGAALGAVAFLFLFTDPANMLTVSIYWQPVATALGAAFFAMLVALLAGRGNVGPVSLILHGFALGALARAGVTLFIVAGPVYRASQAAIWLAGSVHEARWSDVAATGLVLSICLPAVVLMARRMDQLLLDDTSAMATGVAVRRSQFMLMGLSVVLTAGAVSFVGAIGFVGLVAPHAARLLLGLRALPLIAGSAMLGALAVIAADIVVRYGFAPLEVPTGAATALLGAPYFLFILFRARQNHA